jgi:mono/diheme cytochrome c family protein
MKLSVIKVKWITTALAIPVLVVAVLSPATSRARSVLPDGAEALYKAKCASCHAADGSGTTAIGKKMQLRDLRSADVQKQSDAQLTTIITKGKGKMQSYEKSLNADQIKQLVAYMRELGKKR